MQAVDESLEVDIAENHKAMAVTNAIRSPSDKQHLIVGGNAEIVQSSRVVPVKKLKETTSVGLNSSIVGKEIELDKREEPKLAQSSTLKTE